MTRILLIVFLTPLVLLLIGFLWFVNIVPSKPSEDLRQTEAVIVLTGGSERLKAGLDLLLNGYAIEMFVSGVGKGVTVENLFELNKLSPEKIMLVKQRITLGYYATDTFQNGIEVEEWVRNKQYKKIRVVTSNYHIPRSRKELSARLPDVEIITFPVFPDRVKTQSWWRYPGTLELFFVEYLKYIAVSLRVYYE